MTIAPPRIETSVDPNAIPFEKELARDCRTAALAAPLAALARRGRGAGRACRLIERLEGGPFYTATVRRLLDERFGVRIGAYSYGCLRPGAFPAGVTVGRYVSIAAGVRIFLRNHPLERLSLHPFFYNHLLGYVREDNIPSGTLWIGHDAWVGDGAIVTPSCRRIGVGAVIGAGSVVTRDVPDFAIVAGNPAKLIRMRFEPGVAQQILASRWWDRSIEEVRRHIDWMVRDPGPDIVSHPLLRPTDAPR